MNKYKFEIEDKFYPCANHSYWEINPITGEVRDKKTGEIIEMTANDNDYVRIRHIFTQHRLLAETFIEHDYPDGTKLHVHHIDGNKQNNNLDNLMWLSIKEHFNLPEWRELQSKVQTGLHTGENNPMYGYKWSDEQTAKMSALMREVYKDPVHKQNLIDGLKKRGDEWRKHISESHKGKKHTEEWKRNHSEKMKGHKTSEETRKKISLANKGRKNPKVAEALRGRPSGTSGKHWKLVDGKRYYYK